MDYNWFFSSLSQCSAAIAGFLGAFVITKIINRDSEFTNLIRRNNDIKSDIEKQIGNLKNRNFNWYNINIRKDVFNSANFDELISEINHNSITDDDIQYIYFYSNFSPFESYGNLKEEIIKKIKEGPLDSFARSIAIQSREIQNMLQIEREKINNEISYTKSIIDKIRSLQAEIESFPKERNLITFSLISISSIFIIGIIYPLSFLPIDSNFSICFSINCIKNFFSDNYRSFQSILLGLFSLIFLTTIFIFYNKNKKHIFNKSDVEYLQQHTRFNRYSPYLQFYTDNIKFSDDYRNKIEKEVLK